MLIASIPVKDYATCARLVQQSEAKVDGYEFRWDDLAMGNSSDLIAKIRGLSSKIVIFTFARFDAAGGCRGNVFEQWQFIETLCQLKPDYIDLDTEAPMAWFQYIAQYYPEVQVICSYHQWTAQQILWEDIYQQVQHLPFKIFKFAKFCRNGIEAMQLLTSSYLVSCAHQRIMIAMGEHGQFVRVLGPYIQNVFDYVAVGEQWITAPGQLTVDDMLNLYHYRKLSQYTKVYALLGHPIQHSIGHIFHNQQFYLSGQDAVYVKIDVQLEDAVSALFYAEKLGIQGMSITMPLKMRMAELVSSSLPSINTLSRENLGWQGANFDGIAAVRVCAPYLKNKSRIVVLGHGGAAHAIVAAFEAQDHKVYIFARTVKSLHGIPVDNLLNLHVDLVINTVPSLAYDEDSIWGQQVLDFLHPGLKVMDITYQHHSRFLQLAGQLNCFIISGLDMYYVQAFEQQKMWGFMIEPTKTVLT